MKWDESDPNTNLYYLHGAIHLLQNNKFQTFKLSKHKGTVDYPLKQAIQEFKHPCYTPLIVFEGSRKEKIRQISENPYLFHCLNQLETIRDILVLYGVSIVDEHYKLNNDEHIWSKIANNRKLRKIYISIHASNDEFKKKAKAITQQFEALRKDSSKPIVYFNSVANTIWEHVFNVTT